MKDKDEWVILGLLQSKEWKTLGNDTRERCNKIVKMLKDMVGKKYIMIVVVEKVNEDQFKKLMEEKICEQK
jgi:nitrogen regulatory protein PII-like uncharacterized protein